jgi:hypothetical protein
MASVCVESAWSLGQYSYSSTHLFCRCALTELMNDAGDFFCRVVHFGCGISVYTIR